MQRRLMLMPLLALCALYAVSADALAGEGEGDSAQLHFLMIEHVKPSMMATYEEATKELIAALAEYKIDPQTVNFHTVSGPEMGYVYVMELDNFAAMDAMNKNWMTAVEAIGSDRWEEIAARADECVVSRESFFVNSRPDLGYMPEHPGVAREDIAFIKYGFYYITPGHRKQMEDLAKRYADLYRKHGIDHGWSVYTPVTGKDLPLMVVAHAGKSQAHVAAQMEAVQLTLGADGEQLGQEAMMHTRRIELKDGWLRQDLSYPPMGHGADGDDGHGHAHDGDAHHGHDHD